MKALTWSLIALIGLTLFASCTKEEIPTPETDPVENESEDKDDQNASFTVWKGDNITFAKADGADPSSESNQDRINNEVWITRGNNGGQIFNIKTETASSKSTSPAGTKWAIGSIDNIADLKFDNFRTAVGDPKKVVGKSLVLHLVKADVYLSVKFTRWSTNKEGGFSYERSTKN